MLNSEQLRAALAAAKQQFALIREKYLDLKAHLVLSSLHGQTGIDSPPSQILHEFPTLVIDDDDKTRMQNFLSRPPETKTGPETDQRRKEQLDQLASRLQFDETCQVEIRFHHLQYDLLWKLQADDLVDRELTPQTKASIRIVLGTLAHFSETHHET